MARATCIVYVEDDPRVFEATLMLFRTFGYRVVGGTGVEEVLEALKSEAAVPDVVVADLMLGDGPHGLEVVRAVRKRCGRTVPAIIMTGDDWSGPAGQSPLPHCRMLRKPVAAGRLTGLIDTLAREAVG